MVTTRHTGNGGDAKLPRAVAVLATVCSDI